MGNFESTQDGKIDKPFNGSFSDSYVCNILLLGTGGCGKSTTFRQIAKNLEEQISGSDLENHKELPHYLKGDPWIIQVKVICFTLDSCKVLLSKKEPFEKEETKKVYEDFIKQNPGDITREHLSNSMNYFENIVTILNDEKVRIAPLLFPKEFNFADEIH